MPIFGNLYARESIVQQLAWLGMNGRSGGRYILYKKAQLVDFALFLLEPYGSRDIKLFLAI
jgi:hypothetical protein